MKNLSPEAKKMQAMKKALLESREECRILANNLAVERQHHANTKKAIEEQAADLKTAQALADGYTDAMNLLDTLPLNTPRQVCNPHSGQMRKATVSERIVRLAAFAAA